MKIDSVMTLADALRLNTPGTSSEARVCMHAKDACDHYFIIEDRSRYEQNDGRNDYYFVMFLASDHIDRDPPHIFLRYETMVEALIQFSYYFILDNCEHAESDNDRVYLRHNAYKAVLDDLALVERHW